jgi:DNA-binding PadR family transcriptional regulator
VAGATAPRYIEHRYRHKISAFDVDVVRDFQRGALRLRILHHAGSGEVHGARLMEELARHGYRVGPGTLYPLLARLEEAGLLRSRLQVVEGRQRRCYRATPAGRKALNACRRALRELAGEVLGPP